MKRTLMIDKGHPVIGGIPMQIQNANARKGAGHLSPKYAACSVHAFRHCRPLGEGVSRIRRTLIRGPYHPAERMSARTHIVPLRKVANTMHALRT